MCFRFLQVAWTFRRTGELPRHDPTQVEGVEEIPFEDILPAGMAGKDNLHPAAPTTKG
jgi:C4-dicarboxylate transporter DctQ subunit